MSDPKAEIARLYPPAAAHLMVAWVLNGRQGVTCVAGAEPGTFMVIDHVQERAFRLALDPAATDESLNHIRKWRLRRHFPWSSPGPRVAAAEIIAGSIMERAWFADLMALVWGLAETGEVVAVMVVEPSRPDTIDKIFAERYARSVAEAGGETTDPPPSR